MHLVKSTTTQFKKIALSIFVIFSYTFASAQENSPYSRYGMGDVVPAQSISSRSMGGISAGYIDSVGPVQLSNAINTTNAAALGSTTVTTFDLGVEVDRRTLRSNTSPDKFSANNVIISYLQLAFPITPKKMLKKGNAWGIAFGLRPISKVNYKIQANQRLSNIDSISSLFEGTGGINQANFSTGIKIKNLSFGLSTGYSFGNKVTNTKKLFINDTVRYSQSNSDASTTFGGVFLNLGAQYGFRLKNSGVLRIGATANLQQNLKAKRDKLNETFVYNSDGTVISVDTVTSSSNEAGIIKMPAFYTAGFTYTSPTSNWVIGADVDYTTWSDFRFYGVQDAVKNNFKIHVGGQYYPATGRTPTNKYWYFVKYRGGFYYGTDYVNLGAKKPEYGVTLGAGLPLTSISAFLRDPFNRQFVVLNTGIEIGQRGNKQNQSLREGVFRINFGISMTAKWFNKRKYY